LFGRDVSVPDEAEGARGLLRSGDILCYLEDVALGGLRLMVPTSLLEQVHEILSEVVSEEDLTAQAGFDARIASTEAIAYRFFTPGRNGGRARAMLAIAVLCAPALDTLRLFHVGR